MTARKPLPECRWRGEIEEGRCRCSSTKFYNPSGFVRLSVCRDRCPYVDHPEGAPPPPVDDSGYSPDPPAGGAPPRRDLRAVPLPQPRLPCAFEGAVVSYCPCAGYAAELRHVRRCEYGWPEGTEELCTRGDRAAAARCCSDCPEYRPRED